MTIKEVIELNRKSNKKAPICIFNIAQPQLVKPVKPAANDVSIYDDEDLESTAIKH